MESFDDLKNIWSQQSSATPTATEIIQKAEATMKRLKTSQLLTITILVTLTAILITYFIWVGAHRFSSLAIGLGTMISVIIFRISFEWISVNKLRKIKPDSSMTEFSIAMSRFYSWRKRINLALVPAVYCAYIAGFTLSLPFFKQYFSHGMYLYILISGYGSLSVLAIFIASRIKKEIAILNLLRRI